jgi:cellulose synthase (UDP-forming)
LSFSGPLNGKGLPGLVSIMKSGMAALLVTALFYLAIVEMSWPQQAVLSGVLMLLAFALDRSSKSHLITLTMMGMSLFATCRYGYWRLHNVALFFTDARSRWGWPDAIFIVMLVSAEVYAFVILVLGYMQTVWPLHRAPAPLPDDPAAWPEIDLLIPTYNEPLSVVRYTALAALNLDWPPEKLHVYILDDGRREEFRAFAAAANVGYLTRTGNEGAKAGNINHALKTTRSPYLAIFDCDHVPTRSFLQVTVGWFLRDHKLGMLQTPHHFYSPDPFERNLDQFRTIPNEGELFYGIVQDGNDFWNAAFFCGSCAVLRRTALMEIGGIATATVTEDAHTSLLIQKNGWNTAYINVPQAAGLATESLSGHVSQRVRWARGMVQILRLDNPLFARGLTLPQRLCYFNAMMHFMYALPRLIFLTAPLLYLIFSRSNVPGYWAAILAFALPHLVLSSSTNSRIQGMHRHSFWNEIYETVLAPYILIPTIMAMINPKLGKFDVTPKGGVLKESYFDRRIALPFVFLLAINLLGLLMAIPRLVHIPGLLWLWDGRRLGTVGMNCVWTLFNIVIVSVATGVAREAQQRRGQVRITMESPVSVVLPNDVLAPGDTSDLSSSGVRVHLAEPVELAPGQEVQVIFALRGGNAALPVVVKGAEGSVLRLQFGPLTMDQQALLTEALYSRADSWLGWGESREVDRPLRSLARILKLSVNGLGIALVSLLSPLRRPKLDRAALDASRISSLLLPALLLPGLLALPSRGAVLPSTSLPHQFSDQFHDQFTLRDAGVRDPIELYGRVSSRTVNFFLPQMELTQKANLHVYYHLASGQPGHVMRVLLNGTEVTTLTAPPAVNRATLLEQEVSLPAELLVHQNQITFTFSGEPPGPCRPAANLQPEGSIEPETRLVLSGSLLAMADDLTRLPLPFLDPSSFRRSSLPVIFAGPPSHSALEAAGILASYFGMLAGDHQILFPVSISKLPGGNAILIVEDPAQLPPGVAIPWNEPGTKSATVAIRPNPADPAGKLLVLAGKQPGQLVMAAQAIALRSADLTRDAATIVKLTLPRTRQPDDAPRWSRTEQPIALVDAVSGATAQDGSVPVTVYLRLPPDLAYLNREHIPLALEYRYNQVPLTSDSAAQVVVNDQYVGTTPLPSGHNTARIVRGEMELETGTLRPFSNSLSMSFAFRFAHRQLCQDNTPRGMTAALLTGSHLDLRGVPHWASLPDLELLANAGFPFTRYADLAHTTVVLPTQPALGEIALYLMLMGHFAAQTGYPALRVRVDDSQALQPGEDRDLLVIGSLEEGEETIAGLAAMLPISFATTEVDGVGVDVQRPNRFLAALLPALLGEWDKFSGHLSTPPDTGPDHFSAMPDALIAGLESPYAADHSLVLFLLPSAGALPVQDAGSAVGSNGWMGDFLNVAQSSAISGSLSVAQAGQFYSYHLRPSSYHVGRLPWRLRVDRWLTQAPWSVPGGVLACCLPLAFCTRGWLLRRAAARLSGQEK